MRRTYLISGVGPAENEVGAYELFQNYPNPFNPLTLLSYRLSTQSHVKLVIYDMLGREVAHHRIHTTDGQSNFYVALTKLCHKK